MPEANKNCANVVASLLLKRGNTTMARKRKTDGLPINSLVRMSWSQRFHDVYMILWKINDDLNLDEVDILLTDCTCSIKLPNGESHFWHFFLDVESAMSQRIPSSNAIIIVMPKKDHTVFWPTFKKVEGLSDIGKSNFQNAPPKKMFLEESEKNTSFQDEFTTSGATPCNFPIKMETSPSVTMATGIKVPHGVLIGGNSPLTHHTAGSRTETKSLDKIDGQSSKLNPEINKELTTELDGLVHHWRSKSKGCIVLDLQLNKSDVCDVKVEFYEMAVVVKFRNSSSDFCRKHIVLENSLLQWKTQLSFSIIPDKCSFSIMDTFVQLTMQKKTTDHLETLLHESGHLVSPNTVGDTKKISQPGLGYTGLINLGNTCFMNSVIQALANTPELRNYFLDEKFHCHINTKNPLGVGGKMAKAFYVVMRKLWGCSNKAFSPHEFRDVVGLKGSRFTDGMQHDAHEFMAFLLDMLHEDLNTARNSTSIQPTSEVKGISEEMMAFEAWKSYLSRSGSFIIENFHGLLKSQLKCLVCKTKSVKFDPFLFLSVPLPKKVQPFSVFFFRKDVSEPIKITVSVHSDGAKMSDVLSQVGIHTGTNINHLVSYEVNNNALCRFFVPTSPLIRNSHTSTVHIQEMLSPEKEGEPVLQIICTQRKMVPDINKHCAYCKREPDNSFELKRCMNCLKVAYCDRDCQKGGWLKHRNVCRRTPELVGHPFVMCIAKSKATYTNVKSLAVKWAKLSSDVEILSSSMDGENANGEHSVSEMPMELRFSSWKENKNEVYPVIEDKGEELLDFSSRKFLSILWQNDKSKKNYVKVSDKAQDFSAPGRTMDLAKKSSPKYDLLECLSLFTEPEILTQDEAWYCPQCKKHRQAMKKMSLWDLPDVLIIQLKRFSFKNYLWRDKINMFIDLPVSNFDMTSYCNNPKTSKSLCYDLFAVINHHGGILGGHYTTNVRLPDVNNTSESVVDWRLCDDRHVTKLNNKVVTEAAYVMFYHRRSSKNSNTMSESLNIPHEPQADEAQCDEATNATSEHQPVINTNGEKSETTETSVKHMTNSNETSLPLEESKQKIVNTTTVNDSPLSPVGRSAQKLSKMQIEKSVDSKPSEEHNIDQITTQNSNSQQTAQLRNCINSGDSGLKPQGKEVLSYTDMDAID
uniref:ubiquitinyl hydrolase 1 n=1 Tax=Ciona intestinalis TaxID=7719 RepID=Q1RPW0_CIOIN|nr:zinc finger protein [Ciona intestinalis]BAE93325.1 zinc finger protein [Ciona intestinalis]|eukprot:NP_001071926.1 zinc finger protein [Ciona intestinalis]